MQGLQLRRHRLLGTQHRTSSLGTWSNRPVQARLEKGPVLPCKMAIALERLSQCPRLWHLGPGDIRISYDEYPVRSDFGITEDLKMRDAYSALEATEGAIPGEDDEKIHKQYSWTLGCIIPHLMSRELPFREKAATADDVEAALQQHDLEPELFSLLRQLLVVDPDRRLGGKYDWHSIKDHAYFRLISKNIWVALASKRISWAAFFNYVDERDKLAMVASPKLVTIPPRACD